MFWVPPPPITVDIVRPATVWDPTFPTIVPTARPALATNSDAGAAGVKNIGKDRLITAGSPNTIVPLAVPPEAMLCTPAALTNVPIATHPFCTTSMPPPRTVEDDVEPPSCRSAVAPTIAVNVAEPPSTNRV